MGTFAYHADNPKMSAITGNTVIQMPFDDAFRISCERQIEMGPDEARKLLAEVGGFTKAQTERICWLIGHHHTYSNVSTADHRILLEADFLVNSFEDKMPINGIVAFRGKVFRSASAIDMLNKMCGIS